MCEMVLRWMPQSTFDDELTLLLGNKQLTEPMLTQFYVTV